jgi:hypothetical protein
MGEFFCVGQQPLATSLYVLYLKNSLEWPLLAHYSGFHHAGYKRRPRPPPHYNDKHEQVRLILNTTYFKVLVLSLFQYGSFQRLSLCIKIEIFFQFCLNPLGLSNLIMSSHVWCMISFASKALAYFHWSNPRMSSVPMSTKDVKTSQGRLGILWCKRMFLTICTRFDSCPVFPFESFNFLI